MIPADFVTEWRQVAPWPSDFQVEQDLIISRALVEIFSRPELAEAFAFRGGTALHKLHFKPPGRYSEDIDLVQVRQEPIGPALTALRAALDPWLGEPSRDFGNGVVTLAYRLKSEGAPPINMRLKVEINSREHFAVYGLSATPFAVKSRWFSGSAAITTFAIDELLGTKLRALYQRKKGRDLYDLSVALAMPQVAPERIVHCFAHYMQHQGLSVSRAEFEENLFRKMNDRRFTQDISPLLAPAVQWDQAKALTLILDKLITQIPGAAWSRPT